MEAGKECLRVGLGWVLPKPALGWGGPACITTGQGGGKGTWKGGAMQGVVSSKSYGEEYEGGLGEVWGAKSHPWGKGGGGRSWDIHTPTLKDWLGATLGPPQLSNPRHCQLRQSGCWKPRAASDSDAGCRVKTNVGLVPEDGDGTRRHVVSSQPAPPGDQQMLSQ